MSHRFITHDENGDLKVRTPYDEAFIRKLKDLVDRESRKWVPGAKGKGYWHVDGSWEDHVERLVRECFGKPSKGSASPSPSPHEDQFHDVDDPIQSLASYDPNTVIRGLTSKVGVLTYELEIAREEAKALHAENHSLRSQVRRIERAITELTYKLQLAEALGGADSLPRRGPHATLHITEDAPKEVVASAYKALALKHHPDRGGDTETMARINDAYDQLGRS